MRKIRLFKPCVGKEELKNIEDVFNRAWLGLGPLVGEFEEKWSDYIGVRESIGVNSCTAALHLAITAFGFPKGSKVLVSAVTFVSSAHAVLYNGLKPVFVDIDPESLTMSVEDLKRKYTTDCVAILPVHYGGQACRMDEITDFAKDKGLAVIEDCANAAGGMYKGRKLGTWGDIGCFSFEEKKNMTTGDGGMICSNNTELIKSLRAYRWVGIDKDTWKRAKTSVDDLEDPMHWYYEVPVLGYKYNMNDLMAAIGLAQLKKLDWMNRRRSELIRKYLEGIVDCKHLRGAFQYDLENGAYWLMMVRTDKRDELILHLKRKGISTGVHFMPIPLHPLYREYDKGIEVSKSVWKELVTLPLFPELSDYDIMYIVAALREFDDK